MRIRLRRLASIIVLTLVTVSILVGAAHLPVVRQAVARAIEGRIASDPGGARLIIGHLDYNLLALRATLHDVRLSAASGGAQPFFEARTVAVQAPLAVLTGARELTSLELDRPLVRLDPLRAWLDSRPPGDGTPSSPFFLRRLRVTSLDIVGADRADTGFSLDLRELALDSTPDGRGFTTPISGGQGALRAGAYRTVIREVSGRLTFDGEHLGLAPLRVVTGDHDVRVTGRLGLLTSAPSWDLAFESVSDLSGVHASWPALPISRGRVITTGTVSGALDAPRIQLRAEAAELIVAGVAARGLTAEAAVSAATGEVTVSRAGGEIFGGRLTLSMHTGGDRHDANGTVEFEDVSLDAVLAAAGFDAPVAGRARGRLRFDGEITDPAGWDATGEMTVRPGRGTGVPVEGRVNLGLRGRDWQVAIADAAVAGSAVAIRGHGRLPGDGSSPGGSSLGGRATLRVPSLPALFDALRQLRIDAPEDVTRRFDGAVSLDVALEGTIAAPTLRTTLDGTTLRVQGLGEVTVSGRLALTGGRSLRADDVALAAGVRRLSVNGCLDTRSLVADATLAATGWRAADLRALGLEHDYLPAAAVLAARGRVSGPLSSPSVDGAIEAAGVSWFGQTIDRVTGRLAVAAAGSTPAAASRSARSAVTWPGRLQVTDLVATAGAGRIELDGEWDAAARTARVNATAARWTVRPLQVPAADGSMETIEVEAVVDLSIEAGGRLEAPAGTGRLTISDLRFGPLRPGQLLVSLEAAGDGTVRARASAPALPASAEATVRATPPFAYDASVALADIDLAKLDDFGILSSGIGDTVRGTLTARVAAGGTLREPLSSTLTIHADAFKGEAYGLPVALEAPATVRVSPSELSTEGIALRAGATRAVASGTLGDTGGGRFAVNLSGRAGDLLPALTTATGRGGVGDGLITASLVAEGGLDAPRLSGHVTIEGLSLQLDRLPGLTGFSLDAGLAEGAIVLRAARGRLGSATVTATGAIPLRLLEAVVPERVLRATPGAGAATLNLQANGLSVATIGQLAGSEPGEDISGDFDLRASLSASRPAVDALAGRVIVDRGRFATSGIAIAQVGATEIEIRDAAARIEQWRWAGATTDVAVRGALDFGSSPAGFDVEARGPLDLGMLGPLLPGRTAGTLRLDVRAQRVRGQDTLTGDLVLQGGTWIDRAMGIALTGAAGTVRLRGDRAVFEGLTGRLNGGELVVTGAIGRGTADRAFEGAIDITATGVTLEYPPRVVNDLDAALRLAAPGPHATPVGVTGKVLVRPGSLRASLIELAGLFAPAAPLPPTPESERRQRLMAGVGLDVAIDTADDLVADSNNLRAQMGASVRLTGSLAQPGMLGRADIRDQGELFLAGRLYQLRGGRIDFVDATRIEPRLTLLGDTTVSDYEVEMQLTGPVDRIDVRLRSNPPLSQADLASLLTTGQTLKERRENVGGHADQAARTQLLSLVSGEYLGVIGRHLGVDTVRIENTTRDLSAVDLDPVARLTVAKSLGAHLELTYSQSLQESDDLQWILRFKPGWRNVEAKSSFASGRGETYEVRQELQFGGGYVPRSRPAPSRRVQAPRIASVAIEGVPDAEAADLRRRLRLGPGKRFDIFGWQRDRERIERFYQAHDRLRTTVSASRTPAAGGSLALVYRVDRGPVVSLRVEGMETDGAMRDALRAAWIDASIDLFVEDALREAVRLALAHGGYLQPSVRVRVTHGDDRTEAAIDVDRGPRTHARRFAFTGNRSVPSDVLAALIVEAGLADRVWTAPEESAGPIAAHYAAAGFLNVRIDPGAPLFDGDAATLPIDVREGRQFVVSDVELAGVRLEPDASVRRAFGLAAGDGYTAAAAADGVEAVRTFYARRGNADAIVRMETTYERERSTARIALSIEEGTRRTIAGVRLAGDIATRPAIAVRALTLPASGPVDTRDVEESQRRLYDLGVFRSVEPRFEPAGQAVEAAPGAVVQPVDVVFDLEEYARYRLRYGFQLTNDTLSTREFTSTGTRPGLTVDLRRNNLFGLGFDVGGGAFVTRDRSRLRGLVQSSTLGGRPVQTTLSVTRDDTQGRSGLLTVEQRRTLLAAEQRWRPTRRTEFTYGYDLEYDDASLVLGADSAEPLFLSLLARLASTSVTFTIDTRDNVVNPVRGMFHSARIEAGTGWLGSQLRFARYLGQHFVFVPVGRVTWASGLRFGSVGIDDAQKEFLESVLVRFSTGGGTSVRGYRQDALTPEIIEGLKRGGDVLLVLNQEARVRLTPWLGVAGFLDAGNAFARWQDVSWSALAVGVGGGLRLTTPLGVVRLDVGFPRPRPANHPRAVWYFSFGHAF